MKFFLPYLKFDFILACISNNAIMKFVFDFIQTLKFNDRQGRCTYHHKRGSVRVQKGRVVGPYGKAGGKERKEPI